MRCGEDPVCWDAQVAASGEIIDILEAGDYATRVAELRDFIEPYVDQDPKHSLLCTPEELAIRRARPLEFLDGRTDFVRSTWGL